MPPKRTRRSQVEKPEATPSPQKANARKKQAALPVDDEVPSSKAATPRKSRGAKAKEEMASAPDIKPVATPKRGKAKASPKATKVSQPAPVVDEPTPQATETPKKAPAMTRSSRQKRNIKAVESECNDDDGLKEEGTSTESSPPNGKRPRRGEKVLKGEETSTRRKGGRQCNRRGAQVSITEESTEEEVEEQPGKEEESNSLEVSSPVKPSPVRRGRKGKEEAKEILKETVNVESQVVEEGENDGAIDAKVDSVVEQGGDLGCRDEENLSNAKESDDCFHDTPKPRQSPAKKGKKTRATSKKDLESVGEASIKTRSDSCDESPDKGNINDNEIIDGQKSTEVEDEGNEGEKSGKEVEEDLSKEQSAKAMDTEEKTLMSSVENAKEDSVKLSSDTPEEHGDGKEASTDDEKMENDHEDGKAMEQGSEEEGLRKDEAMETDGDSTSVGSSEREKKVTEGESSEGFEGFEADSLQEKDEGTMKIDTQKEQNDLELEVGEKDLGYAKDVGVEAEGVTGAIKEECSETEDDVSDEVKDASPENMEGDDDEQRIPKESEDADDDAVVDSVADSACKVAAELGNRGSGRRKSMRNVQSAKEIAEANEEVDGSGVEKEGEDVDGSSVEKDGEDIVPHVSEPEVKSPVGRVRQSRRRAALQEGSPDEKGKEDTSESELRGRSRRTCTQKGVVKKESEEEVKTEDENQAVQGSKQLRTSKRGAAVKSEISESLDSIVKDEIDKKENLSDDTEASKAEAQTVLDIKGQGELTTKSEGDDCLPKEDQMDDKSSELKKVLADEGEAVVSEENKVMEPKAEKPKEEANLQDQETTKPARERKRKSRWDDPRKLEDRCKTEPLSVSEGIKSTVSNSSVPVKIITTKRDSKAEEGQKSTRDDDEVPMFKDVVFLANSLYEKELKDLYCNENPCVHIILNEDLDCETLVDVVERNKGRYPKNSLWVLISGIHSMAEAISHPGCQDCAFILKRILTLNGSYPSVEEVAENLKDSIRVVNEKCIAVQKVLGSDGVFVLSPPMPVVLALEESFPHHPGLHKTCRLNFCQCTSSKTMQSLYVSYNMFCDIWTKNACKLMTPYLSGDGFKDYQVSNKGGNIVAVQEVKKVPFYAKHKWKNTMFDLINLAQATPYTGEIVPITNEPVQVQRGQFQHAVVIGNVKCLENLKKRTAGNRSISYVDDDVYFDEDGMSLLRDEQKKWPSETLYMILTGMSAVAEPLEAFPQCSEASCDDPLTVYVPKNHSEGDSEFQGMGDEEMVSAVVKRAFKFARNAIDVLKHDSALFLAPIMPLRAIWGGEGSSFSHDFLHSFMKESALPIFGNGQDVWLNCARDLENKWIAMTMENLEADSVAYNLYTSYQSKKPDILQYITDDDKVKESEDFRDTWCDFMSNILDDFLNSKQAEEDVEINLLDYRDLVKESKSSFSVVESSYSNSYGKNYDRWEREPIQTEEPNLWKEISKQLEETDETTDQVDMWKKVSMQMESSSDKSTEKNRWRDMSKHLEEPEVPGVSYGKKQKHSNSSQNYQDQKYSNRDQSSYQDQKYSNRDKSSYQDQKYSNRDQSSYQDQNYSYQSQNYTSSYQGVDTTYQQGPFGGGPWMGGPPPPWSSGPPAGFPPGPAPPWQSGPPPQWMSGPPPMWGSGPPAAPPPGPPPAWGASGLPPWTTAPPPPPSWTTGPPPAVQSSTTSTQPWQSTPPPQAAQSRAETSKSSESAPPKLGTNIMIQNVSCDMRVEQAKKLLEIFGEMTYLKWPLDHLNKPAKFLMACFKNTHNAESSARVLNYVKAFGKDSEIKVVGVPDEKIKNAGPFSASDLSEIASIQDLLNKIKDENSVKIKENSNRVVVSNISSLVPRKLVDALFLSLRANRSFKNCDLSVISSEEEFHYFVCGSVLNVKVMDGYRFPDRKLKVKLIGPDEDKLFCESEKEVAKREIELLMKKHIDNLADLTASKYIDKKEVNIYTFKTVRCQNEKNCKNPGLCHDYHVWKDRRRCPILFRYSDEMCPNLDSNGKCPSRDKCSKAHSPLEIPFHLKNFRAHICSSARKKGHCNKVDKICAYLHPGTTEAFFDRQWRDLYVEGLDKTITYFIGAVMNLFKVSKQPCARVLLITPASEFVTLLVKSMEALSFSCDQEIQALPEDGKAKKATILVGTPQAVINWMAEEKRSKNTNVDRLKALIIDDGPGVVEFIDTHGHNFLIEFAKIKDLNKVITAERINREDVLAMERLRILTDYKKVYAKDDRSRRASPPRDRSSSPPSRKMSHKQDRGSSSSGRSRMDDDRQKYSQEREKQYTSSDEKLYEQSLQIEQQLRQEREKQHEAVLREQEILLQEQLKLQEQIRQEEEMKHEEEMRREQQMRHDLKMMQEREKQMRHEQEILREQEMRQEQERLEKEEKKEKEEAKERKYKKYLTSKEDLKREHERERKLYLELPEVHPEYEEKYRVFLDQYKTHYPGRDDSEHCNKLWMLFWKELVSSMLETAYKKKRELLEIEYVRSQNEEQSEIETTSSSLKRKASSDTKESTKYQRKDIFDQARPGPSSSSMSTISQGLMSDNTQNTLSYSGQGQSSTYDMNRGTRNPHYHGDPRKALPSFSIPQQGTSQFQQVSNLIVSVPQAVAGISEVSDFLGELTPAIRLVTQKITDVNMDPQQTSKLLTDSNNAMIMRIAAGKMKELSDKFPSPNKEKLVLASYQAYQLLEMATKIPDIEKKPYHGLDISKVARATFKKDPTFIIQFIKNALLYEGVTDPTQDDISDIFVTVSNAHFKMSNDQN